MIQQRPVHIESARQNSGQDRGQRNDSGARSADDAPRQRRRRRLARPARGLLWSGIAFLLGACPTLFGAAPLGIALLAAASSHTWYILAGLLLSAALFPVTLPGWTWAGVYLLCVILRLTVRFFVDPPTLPDGRPCRGRTYLRLCWISFKRNAGLLSQGEEDYAEYYPGSDAPTVKTADETPPVSEFRPRLFWEHPFLRMLTAAVGGLVAGVFGVILGGFHLYDLLAALTLLLLTPCATLLLISCFGESGMILLFSTDPLERGRAPAKGTSQIGDAITRKFHALPLCSVCFLLGCVVFAARGFSPMLGTPYLTISLSTLLGLVLTLTAVSRMGALPGLAAGVICGLAASPSLSPVFILCAGCYALLASLSHRAGVIGGCVAGAVWGLSVEGFALFLPLIPTILVTPIVFRLSEVFSKWLWASFPAVGSHTHEDSEFQDMSELLTSMLSLEARSRSGHARMKALSDAFDAISKRFYSLSDQLKLPRMLDLRNICDESFGKQCARCRNRDLCWGAEYDRTLEVQARLAARLHTEGKTSMEDLPDSLRTFCPHMEAIVTDINGRCARMTETLLRSEQTDTFAADYAAMAALLTDALEEDRKEAHDFTCNRESADAIYDYLTAQGVGIQGVVVGGKQSRRQRVIIRGRDFHGIANRMDAVHAELERICGVKLTPPAFEEEERGVVMTLYSEAVLSAEYAGSTVPSGHDPKNPLPSSLTHDGRNGVYEPPAVCGDHIALFKTDNAYLYALISDGMGAGEEASLTSDICAMFLEKMLTAGNKVDISLRMLDTYIRAKNRGTRAECSATVDLMELDLMDGQAVFAKNGAAPTYVVRDGMVYKLHAPTMPIGILSNAPRKDLRFRTHPGDVVVMVSDGVTQGNDECPWLMDLLASPMQGSMDSLRADIIKRALAAGSEDDLSAIAIRVAE